MIRIRHVFIALLFVFAHPIISLDKDSVSVSEPVVFLDNSLKRGNDFATNKSSKQLQKEFFNALRKLKEIDSDGYVVRPGREKYHKKLQDAEVHKKLCHKELEVRKRELVEELNINKEQDRLNELFEDVRSIRITIEQIANDGDSPEWQKKLLEVQKKLDEKIAECEQQKKNLLAAKSAYSREVQIFEEKFNNAVKALDFAQQEWKKSTRQKKIFERIINDNHIDEIKHLWHQLMYQKILEVSEKDLGNFAFLDEDPLMMFGGEFKRSVGEVTHSDKFHVFNKKKADQLFGFLYDWKNPQLTIFVREQRLVKSTTKFIDFIKKLKRFEQSSIIPIGQQEINDAKKLWIATLSHSNDSTNHYESMSQDIKAIIEDFLRQDKWEEQHNKIRMADLFTFIKSSEHQIRFMRLQKSQNTFYSYLLRLKLSDNAGKKFENNQYATLKKLWISIISSDDTNKSLSDMDSDFQRDIRYLMKTQNWGEREKIDSIFEILSSDAKTTRLIVSFYKPQKKFISSLKRLHEFDSKGKIISDQDMQKLELAWQKLINKNENNDKFFQDMDEEFRIKTKIYSLPHNWKVDKNRTELTKFFKKALGRHSRLATLISKPLSLDKKLEKKEDDEERDLFFKFENPLILDLCDKIEEWHFSFKSWINKYQKLRHFMDPAYHKADITLTPKALNRRLKSALFNLKTSFMPDVALEEIKDLSFQVQLLKQFYNYNWLDRILYPFHRDDIQSLEKDFSVLKDTELLAAIHPDFLAKKQAYLPEDIKKAEDINKAIEELQKNLLTRPTKSLETVLMNSLRSKKVQYGVSKLYWRFKSAGVCLLNKISPGFLKTQGEKSGSLFLNNMVKNQKQENILSKKKLKSDKELLDLEVRMFKCKAIARSRSATFNIRN